MLLSGPHRPLQPVGGRGPHGGSCVWIQGSATPTPPYSPLLSTSLGIHRPSPSGLCYLVLKWLVGIEPPRNKTSSGYQETSDEQHFPQTLQVYAVVP